MRRLVRSAISATVTFTLGVAIAMLWSHVFPKKVSLCMLAHDPGAYDRKVVQIEALGSVISSPIFSEHSIIIFESGCTEPDAWATIELKKSYEATPEVDAFINSQQPEIRNAQVVIVGQFDQWASMGCFSPRFGIKAISVRLISPVTSEALPKKPEVTSHQAGSAEQALGADSP
jgi:hypothetical protein